METLGKVEIMPAPNMPVVKKEKTAPLTGGTVLLLLVVAVGIGALIWYFWKPKVPAVVAAAAPVA